MKAQAFTAEELIPLSALQHYLYCPRQCALIHIEAVWTENVFTAEGRLLHERVDSGKISVRHDIKSVTSLPLRSNTLGLIGQADMVEFHKEGTLWQPFPVEYKRGTAKSHDADRIQVCAQALCLEEMLAIAVPEGALFYGKTRRRVAVTFDLALRAATAKTAAAVHALFREGVTPPAHEDTRCIACSLKEDCLPQSLHRKGGAERYVECLRGEL